MVVLDRVTRHADRADDLARGVPERDSAGERDQAAVRVHAVCELFRRLVLAELRKAQRLSEAFHERLLGWSPSGFSVHGRQVAHVDEPGKLERLARYISRAPFALGKIHLLCGPPPPGCG